MVILIQGILRWLTRHAILLVVVIAMLAVAPYIRDEFIQFKTIVGELALMGNGEHELKEYLRSIEREASKRISTLKDASVNRLTSQVDAIEKEIQQKKAVRKRGADSSSFDSFLSGKYFMDRLKLDAEIMILEHERDYLRNSIAIANVILFRKAALAELERLRQVRDATYNKRTQIELELKKPENEEPLKCKLLFWTEECRRLHDLKKAYVAQILEDRRAYENYERQRKLLESTTIPEPSVFKIPQAQIDKVIGPLSERIKELDKQYRHNWVSKAFKVVNERLLPAVLIVLSIILLPIGIKVFLYFIVAPWASGRPPLRILPSSPGSIVATAMKGDEGNGKGKPSAVSQKVFLGENQELLIRPDYLQSTSLQARKRTKLLLNARFPYASVLSGMFLLTRISEAGSEPVDISSTKDPLSEIGIVDLRDGAAFVCQPRSLAGVIQDRVNPVRITRHWRLGNLQSWLTLQLRFLVFHGPGQLIMKGCRGIRIESAGTGRLINQAATLGFSANLDYANTRCETFMSYLTGKEDLFNDLFTGKSGVYVYEEMPDLTRTTGVGGFFEKFLDASMNVFGI